MLINCTEFSMSFMSSAAYRAAMSQTSPSIAVVTGGRSGVGKAIALRIASFPFIEKVLAVSRSIQDSDVAESSKIAAIAADVSTSEGRDRLLQKVQTFCGPPEAPTKQVRFLVHSAGIIDPIKPILSVTPEDLRQAMLVNCEAPFFLTTALYPYLAATNSTPNAGAPGRVLHVSSGAAHSAPPCGWSCYGISKAAFFQSYRVLQREFREQLGGKVLVGTFKPGVVDTSMQTVIREAPESSMPAVKSFQSMKDKVIVQQQQQEKGVAAVARPPPVSALDSPTNVAFFAEYLLVGTTDEEFANEKDSNEYDIRDAQLFPRWIARENLPS